MDKYESFLLGGKKCGAGMTGGMTHEQRLKNLEKARAVRAANLKAKKSAPVASKKKAMKGKGQYNQDYVDESQVNYAGSPLDIYYLADKSETEKGRRERGEVNHGKGVEMELISKAGGRLKKQKVKKEEASDVEESDEEEYTGGKMHKGMKSSGRTESALAFMKHSNHSGMDMPTLKQIKTGGKVKKAQKKIHIEDIDGGALNVDIPDAIKVLAVLATKFGLRLVK